MEIPTVVIAVQDDSLPFYHEFRLPGERIEVVPLADAVARIDAFPPDLCLLDCGFDVRLGLRVLKRVKQRDAGVPVLFLTDGGSEDVAIRAYLLGVRQYLRKPVNIAVLRETAINLLRVKRESRERRSAAALTPRDCPKSRTARLSTECPPCVLRTIRYVEDHLVERISLDQLALHAGVSKYHFCRIFRQYTGMSPKSFVSFSKIKRARELLARRDLTISMIAAELGYRDCAIFDRLFKKLNGLTPTRYRHNIIAPRAA
jgi:YesN/AraC family two-component response regulator